MHTKSVFVPTLLTLTSSDTTFLLRNSLIPFVTSSPVIFSSSPAVQFKLSLLSCSVSIASSGSLHNFALNCAITEFQIFRKQEINSFTMPSGTLMECYKILHFVMSQSSSGAKWAKFKIIYTSLVRPWFPSLQPPSQNRARRGSIECMFRLQTRHASPHSFLNDFCSFVCGASNIFRDKITMLYLHDFFTFSDTDIFEYTYIRFIIMYY